MEKGARFETSALSAPRVHRVSRQHDAASRWAGVCRGLSGSAGRSGLGAARTHLEVRGLCGAGVGARRSAVPQPRSLAGSRPLPSALEAWLEKPLISVQNLSQEKLRAMHETLHPLSCFQRHKCQRLERGRLCSHHPHVLH